MLLSASLIVAGCSPVAVTPPARTFAIDSPRAPARGTDVQVDAANVGALFGPELGAGGVRLRRTIEPGVVGEVDGGLLHVTNDGSGPDRTGYTGRLGVLLQSAEERAALGFGIGGGTSAAAGNWTSIDAGFLIGGKHRYLRPVLGGWLGYSAPVGHHTFTVSDPDDTRTTLQLPHNVFAQATAALEIGPPDFAVIIGMSMLKFWLREDSVVHDGAARTTGTTPSDTPPQLEQGYLAAGIGLRIAL